LSSLARKFAISALAVPLVTEPAAGILETGLCIILSAGTEPFLSPSSLEDKVVVADFVWTDEAGVERALDFDGEENCPIVPLDFAIGCAEA